MLHGVSLSHITSSAKQKSSKGFEIGNSSEILQENASELYLDCSAYNNLFPDPGSHQEEMSSTHRYQHSLKNCHNSGESTNQKYDVIGELSINANNVEDTILKVWENNSMLKEVSRVSLLYRV